MLPFLKKTLLSDNSASNRNFLSKSIKETEGAGKSGEGKRGGGEREEGTASRTKERIWKERVAAASSSEPQHRRPTSVPMVLLPSKGSLPKAHKSQHNGSSFWEKKELHCEVDQQEDRKQGSQICLPDPGIKVKFKGLEEFQTWKLTDKSRISPYKLLVLLEDRFFLLKDFSLHKGLWWQMSILWVPQTEDSWSRVILETWVPVLHTQCCLCKITPGLINQQHVLGKQN